MTEGERIAARARALVGIRFRPQGRDPEIGLDCVGAAAAAAGIAAERVRSDYPLRSDSLTLLEHELCDLGLQPVAGEEALPGDMVVMQAGPGQLHLGISTGTGFVHADAGLRMVVERPCPFPWPVLGIWRIVEAG